MAAVQRAFDLAKGASATGMSSTDMPMPVSINERDAAVRRARGSDARHRPRRELDRVRQHVEHDLLEAQCIAAHRWQAAGVRDATQPLARVLDQPQAGRTTSEAHGIVVQRQPPDLDLRQVGKSWLG